MEDPVRFPNAIASPFSPRHKAAVGHRSRRDSSGAGLYIAACPLEPGLNVSLEKLRRAAIIIGWIALLVIIGSTLSPIDARPHISALGADAERFTAYLAAGALLTLAYPRRRWLVLSGLIALAAGLEWLQTLEMSRHGVPHDALVKMAGALTGSAAATSFEYMVRRFRSAA